MTGQGRPRKPVELLKKDRLTQKVSKATIAAREEITVSLGHKKIEMPLQVAADPLAKKRWLELESLFKDLNLVSSADQKLIARTCLMTAKEERLYNEINQAQTDNETSGGTYFEYWQNGWPLEKELQKVQETLTKYEALLFLTPQARVSAIPMPEKKKPASLIEMSGLRILQKEG